MRLPSALYASGFFDLKALSFSYVLGRVSAILSMKESDGLPSTSGVIGDVVVCKNEKINLMIVRSSNLDAKILSFVVK